MSIYRMMTFRKLWRMVCHRIPEADPEGILQYLEQYAYSPYDYRSVIYYSRKIEAMMIDEGML